MQSISGVRRHLPVMLCSLLLHGNDMGFGNVFYIRQLGGTFVLAKGGKTLLDFRQVHFGDHPSNVAILEALNLDTTEAKAAGPAADLVCNDPVAA